MTKLYFSQLDLTGILFGVNQKGFFYQNMHNSFMNFHSVVGVALFVFVGVLAASMWKIIKFSLPMFLLFLAVILRVSTDDGALFGYFDYAILLPIYFAFSGIYFKKMNTRKTVSPKSSDFSAT